MSFKNFAKKLCFRFFSGCKNTTNSLYPPNFLITFFRVEKRLITRAWQRAFSTRKKIALPAWPNLRNSEMHETFTLIYRALRCPSEIHQWPEEILQEHAFLLHAKSISSPRAEMKQICSIFQFRIVSLPLIFNSHDQDYVARRKRQGISKRHHSNGGCHEH